MATIVYRAGETGTLGFPVDQVDGTPMPLGGLGIRMVIYLPGADLIVPGYASSGEIKPPYGPPVEHPSIASFDATPENFPQVPRAYRTVLQINDGTGWQTLAGFDHILEVRRL